MKPLITLLALSSLAYAFPARLRWNKNPANENIVEYRIWKWTNGTPALVATAAAVADADTKQTHPIEVVGGEKLTVTAFNGFESEHSDPLTVPVLPSKPAGLQVVEIQTSSNMIDWKPIAFVPLRTEDKSRFVRAQITSITP